jgi:hypothetical protein
LRDVLATDLFGSGADRPPATAEPDAESHREARLRAVAARPASRGAVRVADRRSGVALRRRVRRLIWGAAGAASPPATRYERAVDTELDRPLPGVIRTDRLVVRQRYRVDSRIELHFPRGRPRGFVIVHAGHDAGVQAARWPLLEMLARRGYLIAMADMPLHGWNPRPEVRTSRYGALVLTTHDLLALVDGVRGRLLRFFLDPIVATVDVAQRLGFRTVDMVGLSGGGWTTTLAAAVDPRIRRSYPVAGSVPTYLRSEPRNQGDVEQILPALLRRADYQDLYILGALEAGRRQLQVLNAGDPCCYAVREPPTYVAAVQRAVRRARGGTFELRIDRSTEHTISAAASELIVRDLTAGS